MCCGSSTSFTSFSPNGCEIYDDVSSRPSLLPSPSVLMEGAREKKVSEGLWCTRVSENKLGVVKDIATRKAMYTRSATFIGMYYPCLHASFAAGELMKLEASRCVNNLIRSGMYRERQQIYAIAGNIGILRISALWNNVIARLINHLIARDMSREWCCEGAMKGNRFKWWEYLLNKWTAPGALRQ